MILEFEVLVCPPNDFFLGDLDEDVEHGCLYEDGAVLLVCLDVKALEALDAILDCGLVHAPMVLAVSRATLTCLVAVPLMKLGLRTSDCVLKS